MPILHRNHTSAARTSPAHAVAAEPMALDAASGPVRTAQAPRAVPATRTSVAWAGVWVSAIMLIAVIVFMLQNTRSVQVSFLGMDGALSPAVGFLIAMVAGVLVTLVLGTSRITHVRRLVRRRRR